MFSELRAFWADAGSLERAGYRIGAALVASGLFHLGVFAVDGGPWEGPVSWRKAVTFGLSFGITLITIVWVSSFVPLGPRERRWLLGAFTAACVMETALVTMQAWRGVPSHFDQETTFDTIVSRALAAGGGVLIVTIAAMTAASFRANPSVAPSLRLAVRAGFVALDVALLLGAVMIARGVTEVVAGHQQRAYLVGGFLKPGHAATMHGILILPALAWLASFTGWTERRRGRIVGLATAGYALFAAAVVAQSLVGAPLVAFGFAGLGAITLLAAGVITLAALTRRGSGTVKPA
jgi:hypothetical protein